MNRFDSMTKDQYHAAKKGFFLQYNPPACKPVETMDLVLRKEKALAIIKGDWKVEFRQINDDNYNMLNDEEVYDWMMDHRMDEGMDTGDMILTEEVDIDENETTGELWNRIME